MQQLDAHDNELDVRERMAKGLYNGEHLGIAQEWLRRREDARSAASASASAAREERMVAIHTEANLIAERALDTANAQAAAASASASAAREQALWAKWAAIIATVAAIIATVAAIK